MVDEERAARFGLAVAHARLRANLSQHALAAEIGSTQSTISSWEQGKSEPPPDMVFAIERACALVPGELSRLLNFRPLQDDGMPDDVENAILICPKLDPYKRQLLRDIYLSMVADD